MFAYVTYIQKTKNPNWDIVHCMDYDTGKVAIALCKTGVQIGNLVHVRRQSNVSGVWTSFATVKEAKK